MQTVVDIVRHQREHADELERLAELKERQVEELELEILDLRRRASRLRFSIGYAALTNAGDE